MVWNERLIRLYYDPESGASGTAVAQETDGDSLAAEAYAEMNGQEIPKKKEPVIEDAEPPQEPASKEAEPQDVGNKDGQQEEEKSVVPPVGDEKPESIELSDDVINNYAQKHKVTYAQAKEDLEQSKAILDKYKDPLELARAHREQQREYDRLKNEAKKPVEQTPQLLSDAELKAELDAYANQNADKIVAKYRQDFPKRTDSMDDEAILEWAKDDAAKNYRMNASRVIEGIKTQASSRRAELLSSIPKEDERFAHDVELILGATPDRVIINPNFGFKDVLDNVRGQRYHSDVKSAYERGLKEGREQPKILGVNSSSSSTPKRPASLGKASLSQSQKNAAYDQFPDSTPAKAEEMWVEVYAEDLKKNPNYLPV